jgi:hypothetical protein
VVARSPPGDSAEPAACSRSRSLRTVSVERSRSRDPSTTGTPAAASRSPSAEPSAPDPPTIATGSWLGGEAGTGPTVTDAAGACALALEQPRLLGETAAAEVAQPVTAWYRSTA